MSPLLFPSKKGEAKRSLVRMGRMGSRERASRRHGGTIKVTLAGGAPPVGANIETYVRVLQRAFKQYTKPRGGSFPRDEFAHEVVMRVARKGVSDQSIMLREFAKILHGFKGDSAKALKYVIEREIIPVPKIKRT
jgi:hypothetical protein